jgi:hypothetical protein
MKIDIEFFDAALYDEVLPLAQKSWNECSEIKKDTCAFHGQRDFEIIPDKEQYLFLQRSNALIALTLRDEYGVLHGYALGILYRSLHHQPVICGNVDSFYIEPEKRAYVRSFIARIEAEFAHRDVVIMGWPTTASGSLFAVLRTLGYIADDVVMEKMLKKYGADEEQEACALQQP